MQRAFASMNLISRLRSAVAVNCSARQESHEQEKGRGTAQTMRGSDTGAILGRAQFSGKYWYC